VFIQRTPGAEKEMDKLNEKSLGAAYGTTIGAIMPVSPIIEIEYKR
jgi:hypothetical protein